MASTASLAIKMQQAHERAEEVLEGYETPKRVGVPGTVSTKHPVHLAAYQAELIADLAGIVKDQGRRIADLETSGERKKPPL